MNEHELEQFTELYSKAQELINNRSIDYCRTMLTYKKASREYDNFIGCDSWDISIDDGRIGCNYQYTEGSRGYYNTYSDSIEFPDIMFTFSDEEWQEYLSKLKNKLIKENISYEKEEQRKKYQEELDKQKRAEEREYAQFQRLNAKYAAKESK